MTSERLAGQTIRLTADDASLTIDPTFGGRIVSARILGRDVLVSSGPRPIDWGCFPMVPFAGRLRDATLRHAGREWRLPATEAPHAIHGTVATRPWRVDDDRTLSIDLGPDWPFRGRVTQHFDLQPGRLRVELELQAHEPMPAMLGWHPWFRWYLDGSGADSSGRAELELAPGAMYERDADGIALDRLVPPPPGPWDDCFTGLARPPVVRWPGGLELRIESSCPDWVVFTESPRGLCVEPQTGPPDAPNTRPQLVEPGSPLRADMCWSWLAGSSGGQDNKRRLAGTQSRPAGEVLTRLHSSAYTRLHRFAVPSASFLRRGADHPPSDLPPSADRGADGSRATGQENR